MESKCLVRIMKTTICNFKNVNFGEVKYRNYGCIEKNASIEHADIVGVYGQNGSGKTALVEAMDILKYILSGMEIPYSIYAGILSKELPVCISTVFFIEKDGDKYKVQYDAYIRADDEKEKIEVYKEKITYWLRGTSWKAERDIEFVNPYYETDDIMEQRILTVISKNINKLNEIEFLHSMQNLAIYCSQRNISVFFNQQVLKSLSNTKGEEAQNLYHVLSALYHFANMDLHVIKVSQLGDINKNKVIPLNVHYETETSIMQGCLPLFINGQGELPESLFDLSLAMMNAINIAIRSIIPNLQIDMERKLIIEKEDGKRYVQVEVYSNRNGKRFLIRYESEGIKRIISILNYLISVYNHASVCLVVDEMDSGIFEYLLGELLGMMHEEMKGQLIFTSHNLRVLEKFDTKNIICSTTNPNNRYIRLSGIGNNNNKRDFYIRAITVGGQKEELYEEDDLISMGYAFRKAGRVHNDIEIPFSNELEKNL